MTPDLLLRYALGKPITVAIVGCSSAPEVETLAAAGRIEQVIDKAELRELIAIFKKDARQLAFSRGVI